MPKLDAGTVSPTQAIVTLRLASPGVVARGRVVVTAVVAVVVAVPGSIALRAMEATESVDCGLSSWPEASVAAAQTPIAAGHEQGGSRGAAPA